MYGYAEILRQMREDKQRENRQKVAKPVIPWRRNRKGKKR